MHARREYWKVSIGRARMEGLPSNRIWEEVSVVDRARTTKELLVKDAIHIDLFESLSLNRNGGLELPVFWMAALKSTESRAGQR